MRCTCHASMWPDSEQLPLWTSSSPERVLLLPTKLEPAAEEEAEKEMEEKRCRLCLEGEDDSPLVQPCGCRGSAKWAHKACLERWRRTSVKEDAAYRCGECMDEYRDALSLELLSARLQAKRTSGQNTLFTLNALAAELHDQGKFDEAEPLLREALAMSRKILGHRHQNTLSFIGNLGMLLHDKGDLSPLLSHCTARRWRCCARPSAISIRTQAHLGVFARWNTGT